MYFNIKCIGKLLGQTNEFERSLVLETGEFDGPKFDCIYVTIRVVLTSVPGPEVIKVFSYSTKLSTKFILLINIKHLLA